MINSHEIKYGKIKEYNGFGGEIITKTQNGYMTYYFSKNELIDETEVLRKHDLVSFKGKTEDILPQAYFVKKIVTIPERKN